MYGIQNNQTQ